MNTALSTLFVTLLYVAICLPFFIEGTISETGLVDQTVETIIDGTTCRIFPKNSLFAALLSLSSTHYYACAAHTFLISSNVSAIPPLAVQWYYRSSVVMTNGTGCSAVQINCSSTCSSTSTIVPFTKLYSILPPCSCTNIIPNTQNISIQIVSPFTNTTGNALSYPLECGSLPSGTSKIIYRETDILPYDDDGSNPSKKGDEEDSVQRIYGAPLAAVVTVAVLTTFMLFGTIRGIIYYQQKQKEKLDESSSSKIQPLPDLSDVIDQEISDNHEDHGEGKDGKRFSKNNKTIQNSLSSKVASGVGGI